MDFPIHILPKESWPPLLHEINDPPTQLFFRGAVPDQTLTYLSVVGARKYSSYGKEVVSALIEPLRGYPISIVSGLALGIDSLAHEAALRAGLHTTCVPGSGLLDSVLYPRSHTRLAHKILEAGSSLLSEFENDFHATPWGFPQRNRIMAGMSRAVLLVEATEKSGTLITAKYAVDYNRDVLVVPGSIFSANSAGPHLFMRLGATPVRSADDILDALDMAPEVAEAPSLDGASYQFSTNELLLLTYLNEPLSRDELIRKLALPTSEASILISMLEIRGYLKEYDGLLRRA